MRSTVRNGQAEAQDTPFDMDMDARPISTIFGTCVYLLTHALRATTERDDTLRLGALTLRLTRWGKAVGIEDDSKGLAQHGADTEDIKDIREALAGMISVFERHFGSDDDGDRLQRAPPARLQHSLVPEIEEIVFERCGEPDDALVRGRFKYQLEKLDVSLWREASDLVSELEEVLPAADIQRDLFAAEQQRFPNWLIAALQRAARHIDPWFEGGASGESRVLVDTASLLELNQRAKVDAIFRGIGMANNNYL